MRDITTPPQVGVPCIAYLSNGGYILSVYKRVLTWKGYKMKFVNLLSNGLWKDNVIGWNNIPSKLDTI